MFNFNLKGTPKLITEKNISDTLTSLLEVSSHLKQFDGYIPVEFIKEKFLLSDDEFKKLLKDLKFAIVNVHCINEETIEKYLKETKDA